MIQALSSNTSQKAFPDCIGPRGVIGRFEHLDATRCYSLLQLERNRAQTCYHDRE